MNETTPAPIANIPIARYLRA
ncbi:MAG: hypothetical protein QOK11_849, partial [Pseudonocardiales bacterium]|nr:hypothetical protein [Pseudonocardiales bacterium]